MIPAVVTIGKLATGRPERRIYASLFVAGRFEKFAERGMMSKD
jgi:hypothetical protein